MNKIKIISNPYEKRVLFERWNNQLNSWTFIDEDSNSNSKLISSEYQIGFFPFKVYEIINQIITEYSNPDDVLSICFSGSDDEYQELERLITDIKFENIQLEKSENYLENARDVLPEINRIFQKLDPLITKNIEDESGEIQQQLKRFSDASNDIVPICVLGTYSAGKSTFINSLIGCELLPSAETPVTAKVYKLSSTPHKDRASIRISFKEKEARILFRDNELVVHGLEDGEELLASINEVLDEEKPTSIIEKVRFVLEELNDVSDSELGDLIEIEIPFSRSALDDINYKIAIFDTPGSNSSTNLQHSDVLDKAMKGMSNGLPIFVTDSSSMDSTDNDNLKDKLKKVAGLDSRFTMIVVNKAETADISLRRFKKESFKQKIMNQSIPRELYGQGIFYVSSILGLGAKLDGNLKGEFYSELFDTYKAKYSDPENDYYKRLFDFNILPRQMISSMVETAESNSNIIYANSGLLTIEDTIKSFVNKYSHYDKCQQARDTLNQLIGITDKEIEEKNQELGSRKVELQNKLDSQKSEILETIDKSISHEREDYTSRYPEEMLSYLQSLTQNLKKERAESLYKDSYERIDLEYPEVIVDDIHSGSDAFSKLKGHIDNYMLGEDRRRKLEEQASTEVLNVIKQEFSENLVMAKEHFNLFSKEFWLNATSDVRKELEKVISGDLDLQPEKRKAISEIIISYEEIDFNQFDLGKFNRDELSYIFRIGDYRLKSNKINISGLTNTYNKEFKAKLTEFSESIRSEHERKFNNWMQDLGSLIKSNIIEFSPELKELDQRIQKVIKEIYSLEEQQKQIKTYVNEIKQMISWK
ncbi:dynamin family protein [Streptococcus sanguinis]|uniref:dynamin family protein n=2 Tax=Streptococcus sanguinis TaxID=1305 RepID=UPI001CBE1E57|nr:dynamin family protein [Streptococcus sanguinis]MBZ2022954.1 dynamin family protein [Streptococcus sanguinis]MBZ2047652.1 dynamin family protein [Streptococcus sanguinis]MBZ2049654.1 dynamin family protein [Streptococcus sanguinis]MBZ2059221.1 dynamin family protein [Streptococcus sanguinis]MCC3178436.1 50S ribosome-binding GTPase family protein [Streptococcus sanguinis]